MAKKEVSMKKILVFSGSTRVESLNLKLSKNVASIAENLGAKVEYLDLSNYPIPIYNGDIEQEGLPNNVVKLRDIFKTNQSFIVTTPEYNGFFPPLIKNVVDWLSRGHKDEIMGSLFNKKNVLILSASPGEYGGIRAVRSLTTLFENLKMEVFPESFCLAHADKEFNIDGALISNLKYKEIERIVKKFINK